MPRFCESQVRPTAVQQPIDSRHVAENQWLDEQIVPPVIPWYARHLLLPSRAAGFAVGQMPEGVDAERVELRDGQLNGQPNGQVNGQEAAEKKHQQRQHQWPDLWQPDHGEAHLVDSSGKRLLEPRALLVDAFGTLVETAEEETMVYASIGQKFGVEISPEEIGRRYEVAYRKPWLQSKLRYEGDALPFWHHIISESTGCSNPSYAQELHGYYIKKHAWRFTDPNAREAFAAIRRAGIKIALVSNFDTRLRDLLRALDCYDWFDAVAVSAEVEAEKPSSEIFHAACDMLGVLPHEAVHVGDSRNKDVAGARRAGCGAAWLWNEDVHSFTEAVHVGDSRNKDVGGARRAGCGAAWLWNEDVHSFTEVAQRLGVSIPAASPEAELIRFP
ncbi:unnamed protein product [Closterium sp. NIES-65]|nr:unnamed protein product [Closterium sp. NIES-65]